MFVLEYLIVFLVVYLIYYYFILRHNIKYDKKKLPVEIVYLKVIYKININKENYSKFLKKCAIINAFIISTIYIICYYLLKSWIPRIIIGIILLILMIIICYGILARYYLWKEGR